MHSDVAKTLEQTNYNANHVHSLRVLNEFGGQRLDQILAQLVPQHSRSRLQNWIREGRVTVDALVVKEPKQKLIGGEALVLTEGVTEETLAFLPENIPLPVIYEDETILVIDKPVGLVVHPGSGNWSGTLLNALLYHVPGISQIPRAGIVHRLDKDTSGLMVVAKTLEAQTHLVRQLQARSVKRYYRALVRGLPVLDAGEIDAPIGRHPSQRIKMAVVVHGKHAKTYYRVVERFIDCALLDCALETGRTHQIRVHMTHLGHPLVGDTVYGHTPGRIPAGPSFARQALHARRLELTHPATEKRMSWKSEVPEDMEELISLVRQDMQAASAIEEEDWDVEFDEGPEIIMALDDDDE